MFLLKGIFNHCVNLTRKEGKGRRGWEQKLARTQRPNDRKIRRCYWFACGDAYMSGRENGFRRKYSGNALRVRLGVEGSIEGTRVPLCLPASSQDHHFTCRQTFLTTFTRGFFPASDGLTIRRKDLKDFSCFLAC